MKSTITSTRTLTCLFVRSARHKRNAVLECHLERLDKPGTGREHKDSTYEAKECRKGNRHNEWKSLLVREMLRGLAAANICAIRLVDWKMKHKVHSTQYMACLESIPATVIVAALAAQANKYKQDVCNQHADSECNAYKQGCEGTEDNPLDVRILQDNSTVFTKREHRVCYDTTKG